MEAKDKIPEVIAALENEITFQTNWISTLRQDQFNEKNLAHGRIEGCKIAISQINLICYGRIFKTQF